MNELYLVIMFVVITMAVVLWCQFDSLMDYFIGFLSILISTCVSIVMLALSIATPTGEDIVKIHTATNTKIGNELIIQANGVPTQVITDIKFIDAPVQIKEILYQNAWGSSLNTVYEVETIKTEIQSQP